MIGISLIQHGPSPREIFLKIKGNFNKVRNNLIILAQQTRDTMRNTINSSAKNSQGDLEKAIDVEVIDNVIGIGNISMLPPYWWVLNYGTLFGTSIKYVPGRKATNPTVPKFIPGYWANNEFIYTPHMGKGMIPKNPITPINYIETAINFYEIGIKGL